MPLLQARYMRRVGFRARAEDITDEDRYEWSEIPAYVDYANIQPTGMYRDNHIQNYKRLYGEHPEKAVTMYYTGAFKVTPGMGVCVDAPIDAPCDYRVTGVESWPMHVRAYLAYIPANRRGRG